MSLFEFSIFGLDRHHHDSLIQILQLFGSIIHFRFVVILKNSVFDFSENLHFFADSYYLFFDDSSKRAESLIRNEVN